MENLLFSGNPDILMCNMGAITDNTDWPNIRKGQHDTIQIIIFPMILQHEKIRIKWVIAKKAFV